MRNTFENSNQLTTECFGTHYGVKHHLQTIIVTKKFINNLQYQSASRCEQFGKQNRAERINVIFHNVLQQLMKNFPFGCSNICPYLLFIKARKLWFTQSH